ncbi:CBD9-like protein [Diplocarpon rosae]|nr:CBD9-like protein [Diplocarpon rosae]
MNLFGVLGALALMSSTTAQNVTYCPSNGVCYVVNVPETTAATGDGDLFFQISGPTRMSWIGLGQGSSMSGSNIFMVYANAAGDNVTLSPRLGAGEREPTTSGSSSQLTLLSGSGIVNGVMNANVRCSNCGSWSGGSMSLNSSNSNWIWAYKSGAAISSDDVNVNLDMHSSDGSTTFNLQQAAGGNSANPFSFSAATALTSNTPSSSSSISSSGSSDMPSNSNAILMAHGILGSIAFVILYPLGAIAIRLFSFRGLVFLHAGWMVFTYTLVLASMGLGVWTAVTTHQLSASHSIIGLVVVSSLLLQPFTGLAHHLLYKRSGQPNAATYPHVWWGRAIVTLGIINGGLGLQLASNTRDGEIAYGVIAGVMWLAWMGIIVLAFIRGRGEPKGESGDGAMRLRDQNESRTGFTQPTPTQIRFI